MRNGIQHVLVFVVFLALAADAGGEPPPDLSYQGKLLNSAGEPLAGPVNLTVRIFDQPSDGTQLYAEEHQNVALQDGVFDVLLGTGANPQGTFDAQLFEATNRWLEVVVDAEVLKPRQPFSSVAYALQTGTASFAQRAGDADTLDGLDSVALDQSAHATASDNPHGVTAAQTGAATAAEVDASIGTHAGEASAHHAKTADFNELAGQASEAQIPDAIARDSEVAAEVATLQADIAALQGQLATLQGTVDGLTTLLASATLEDGGTTFRFTGVNVQVVDGSGDTFGANALGNLIVGYNEAVTGPIDRSGSHNLVVGSEHTYSSYGGFVAGFINEISAPFASVSGGRENTASGFEASVSGGLQNVASGEISAVSGGEENTASSLVSSVSGGLGNMATSRWASVSGGTVNTASGEASSVSGGGENTASGVVSTVSGGTENVATGRFAVVSGGRNNQASGESSLAAGGGSSNAPDGNIAFADYSAVLGGANNDAGDPAQTDSTLAINATIVGGRGNRASGNYANVSGGRQNVASGSDSSVSGGRLNESSGVAASVAGGGGPNAADGNLAFSNYSAILGGRTNLAGDPSQISPTIGVAATVSGGAANVASGQSSAVSGGSENSASGATATVSGGEKLSATGLHQHLP